MPGENAALVDDLRSMGLAADGPLDGRYGDPEKSYLIHNPTREQMFELGRRHGQESVVFCGGGGHRELLYTNGPNAGKAHPGLATHDLTDEEPEDNYTHIPGLGYLRLHFDFDRLDDRIPVDRKSEPSFGWVVGGPMRKGDAPSEDPHAYRWHDGHTSHNVIFRPPMGVMVRTAGSGVRKADGWGVASLSKNTPGVTYGDSGGLESARYPLGGRLGEIQRMVKDHGYTAVRVGERLGRPEHALHNYDTGHLTIHDSRSTDQAERDQTEAWRLSHELAHALTLPEVNSMYGEARRVGRLGPHRTLHEGMRAAHWEWLAGQRQRQLLESVGVRISDEAHAREMNHLMRDAVHRVLTNEMAGVRPEPHPHLVPLDTSLQILRDAAANLGLGRHERSAAPKRRDAVSKTVTIPELCGSLAKAMQSKIDEHVAALANLRKAELRKAERDDSCLLCKKGLSECGCLGDLSKNENRKVMLPGEGKKKGRLPGDKAPKEVKVEDSGHGGDVEKVKKAVRKALEKKAKTEKAEPPTAPAPTKSPTAPHPTAAAGSPKIGAAPALKAEIPGRKVGEALAKAVSSIRPVLGGKDPASRMMTQHAFSSASTTPAEAEGKGAKLTPEDHARRAAEFSAFTPAGAFTPTSEGASAGKLKAGPPKPIETPHVGKPTGTSASPGGGLIARFTSALRGEKKG